MWLCLFKQKIIPEYDFACLHICVFRLKLSGVIDISSVLCIVIAFVVMRMFFLHISSERCFSCQKHAGAVVIDLCFFFLLFSVFYIKSLHFKCMSQMLRIVMEVTRKCPGSIGEVTFW